MILQLITSFIAAASFCILFNARGALLQCGLAGMVGWILYLELDERWDTVIATFAATVVVGVISQFFARSFKMPVIIFSVGGIIPLVPGDLRMMLCANSWRMTITRRFRSPYRRCCSLERSPRDLCSAKCLDKCSAGRTSRHAQESVSPYRSPIAMATGAFRLELLGL